MNEYRKRRSSESLESDRKRISYERYDCASYIKQEYNHHVSNNGRLNDHVAVARAAPPVPYNYYTPVAPDGIRSAVVYNPERYYNKQYVEAYQYADKGNAVSSTRNYNSGYDQAIAIYDERRQMNFKHEVYINSLRQSEPRYVNMNDLRKHLSDIDIRCLRNFNFSTALDLTLELESSLKYFVDTRNELVFLRKLQRQQCIPFSYNEINITNRSGLHNRLKFLENESAYRSNRMNQLFHQLQSVVIPSIIDDIRYVHSLSYDKSWANRGRYWFSLFKQIKWENSSRSMNSRGCKYEQSNHRRAKRIHNVKDEIDVANRKNIKSEVVILPKESIGVKSVKVEIFSKIHSKDALRKQDQLNKREDNRMPIMSNIVEKTIETADCNNNLVLVLDKNVESEPQATLVENSAKVDHRQDEESESDLSKSVVIIEPNVSLVTVTDDDNHDLSSNAIPPEGDMKN